MAEPAKDDTQVTKSEPRELEFEGYKFKVDTDLLDDVEAFEIIDRIENKNQVTAVVPLLEFLIGKDGYNDMKAHFVKTEGRFRVSKLTKVYELIVENFDPKG